jgi:hypothetical protein
MFFFGAYGKRSDHVDTATRTQQLTVAGRLLVQYPTEALLAIAGGLDALAIILIPMCWLHKRCDVN